MALDPALEKSMLAMVPHLRAFAIALCKHRELADDLVQETLVRALTNIHLFEPGTNLSAWLLTILRNQFRSECRKRRRNVEDADGKFAETLKTPPDQEGNLAFEDLWEALGRLSVDHREALICIAMSGFSYGAVADFCCLFTVGTVKSRVSRARRQAVGDRERRRLRSDPSNACSPASAPAWSDGGAGAPVKSGRGGHSSTVGTCPGEPACGEGHACTAGLVVPRSHRSIPIIVPKIAT